jgi:hypothetical protein
LKAAAWIARQADDGLCLRRPRHDRVGLMAIDYSLLPLSKGTPRCLQKARKKKLDAKDERACREIVRARDKGRCRVPNCNERNVEMHHIVPRSRSSKLKWDPRK